MMSRTLTCGAMCTGGASGTGWGAGACICGAGWGRGCANLCGAGLRSRRKLFVGQDAQLEDATFQNGAPDELLVASFSVKV